MDEQAALLRAVAESPDDDVPRLVYADWLEEHDLAEFAASIRHQITLLRRPYGEYIRHLWDAGRGPLHDPRIVTEPVRIGGATITGWSRGFAESLIVDHIITFLTHAADVFQIHPIRSLHVDQPLVTERARLLTMTELLRCRRLVISEGLFEQNTLALELGWDSLEPFLTAPTLRNVDRLVTPYLTGGGALPQSYPDRPPLVWHPREWELHYPDLDESMFASWLASPMCDQLTHLAIQRGNVGERPIRTLIRTHRIHQLQSLHLQSTRLAPGELRELADCAPTHLRALHLEHTNVDADEWDALLESPLPGQLRELSLHGSSLPSPQHTRLVTTNWPHLRLLDLTATGFGTVPFRHLMAAPWLGSLQCLILNQNRIEGKGAATLAESAGARQIPLLGLRTCALPRWVLLNFLSKPIPGVRQLDLQHNGFQDSQELGNLLLDAEHLEAIEYLDFGYGAIWGYFREAIDRKFGRRINA